MMINYHVACILFVYNVYWLNINRGESVRMLQSMFKLDNKTLSFFKKSFTPLFGERYTQTMYIFAWLLKMTDSSKSCR